MQISLSKKPKAPTIIVGFPGVGLIGPIVTEYLIEHMKTERIGEFEYDELPPTAAIHKGQLVHPMSLHYSKAHNALICYTILNIMGQEWTVAKQIGDMAKQLGAKEIICIDGANIMGDDTSTLFSHGNETFTALGAKRMDESVITGVTGALLLTHPSTSCIFASTQMETPNAKAAADVVKFLDRYLKLDVDPAPLMEQAERFEKKLKSLADQSQKLQTEKERRSMDYLG